MSSPPTAISDEQNRMLDELVQHYLDNQSRVKSHLEAINAHITESKELAPFVHSIKRRLKKPDSLKDKLERKLRDDVEANQDFHLNKDNLLTEINDLGAYRILHLHTRQMGGIHRALLNILQEAGYSIIDGPFANVWDFETQKYFDSIGIETKFNPRLYSSVHYAIQPNSKIKVTLEIQVRTLSEEVWGEVDHRFNYPHPIDSIPCGEQIKVLARVASSCSRLVDSIFASYDEYLASRSKDTESIVAAGPETGALAPAVVANEPGAATGIAEYPPDSPEA